MFARSRLALGRLLGLHGSPHGIALGFTLGVGLSLVPIPFLGMVVALALAPLVGGSPPATYLGTLVVNPLSGALFYFAELWLGATLLGIEPPGWHEARTFDSARWGQLFVELLPAFALGGLVTALLVSAVAYPSIRAAVARYQRGQVHG